jgi:hypothetical protein
MSWAATCVWKGCSPTMQSKTQVSLLILLVLGLHAVPVIFYQGNRQTRWPFLAWAMYAQASRPGPIAVAQRRLIATSTSGQHEEITAHLVGLPGPAFRNRYITPLWNGDSTPAYELIERLNRRRDDPVVQLRMEGERLTLVDTGVATETLPVVTYRADTSASRGGTSP